MLSVYIFDIVYALDLQLLCLNSYHRHILLAIATVLQSKSTNFIMSKPKHNSNCVLIDSTFLHDDNNDRRTNRLLYPLRMHTG